MHYTPFKTRIYAFLLDYLVIAIYCIFVAGTISFVFKSFLTPLFSGSPVIAELTGFLLLTLPVSLYFILFESSKWQGTWGKKKMSIRVLDRASKRIGLGRSTVQTAIKFLPWEVAHFGMWRLIHPTVFSEITIMVILYVAMFTVLIYLLSPLSNKKRRTIYDWIAGTKVVS
ncbi:RDD family protein [Bacillus sp. FJAT-49754]|nr:RDD family protein [Lederbergia citrea]